MIVCFTIFHYRQRVTIMIELCYDHARNQSGYCYDFWFI